MTNLPEPIKPGSLAISGYQPGEVYMNKDGWYILIDKVEGDTIFYRNAKIIHEDGSIEWEAGVHRADHFGHYEKPIRIEDVAATEALAIEAVRNPQAFAGDIQPDDETQALTVSASPEHLDSMRRATATAMQRVESLHRIVERKARTLQRIVGKYRDQVDRIQKVIGVLEMYLGVNEEIVQIRDGQPASMGEPIAIRQRVLFMDEEVGDPRMNRRTGQRGIDFQSVEDFDAWVVKPENTHLLLPHEKGIMALNPSRQNRTYSNNAFENIFMKANNDMTYLLIRNGERLYRIWTGVGIAGKLLPSPGELDAEWKGHDFPGDRENREFTYRKKALLLQGIIDRTEVFLPMAHVVNLFDAETFEDGLIQLVFDAEPSLAPPGRPMYQDWKKEINSQIGRGSRIIVNLDHPGDQIGNLYGDSWDVQYRLHRYVRYYSNRGSAPNPPPPGLYQVEDVRKSQGLYDNKREQLIIYYQPGGEVSDSGWSWETHPRKNRVGFIVYRDDSFVLNYDGISLEDVEWFIKCRYEREHYLELIPLLWEIRDRRLAELEWEREFVRLVAYRTGKPEETVWEAVAWWKTKNIWKRPIMEDDAKALRMIEARVKGE